MLGTWRFEVIPGCDLIVSGDFCGKALGAEVLKSGPSQPSAAIGGQHPASICTETTFCHKQHSSAQGCVRTADNHRRRVPPIPPDQSDQSGKKRNFPLDNSGRGIFGTQIFGSQTPPSLLIEP